MDQEDKDKLNQATGLFVRPKRRDLEPSEHISHVDAPTQKIILFPTEVSQAQPEDDPTLVGKKPPIILTPPMSTAPPLARVDDLPEDFFEIGELDELEQEDDAIRPPDFSRFLRGDELLEEESPSKEESKLAHLVKELNEKADHYAEHMFQDSEEENQEELHRLERLIPGTDFEDGKRVAQSPTRQKVKKKRQKPVPPDVDPKKLGAWYAKGLKQMKQRRQMILLLFLLSIAITLFPDGLSDYVPVLGEPQALLASLSVLLFLGLVLSGDLLLRGLERSFRLKIGADTLVFFGGLFCGLDCFVQLSSPEPRDQFPFVSLTLLHYYFLLYGEEEKRHAHRHACRVASLLKEPFLLTLEPNKWNGKPAYTKSSAPPDGFTSQLQQDDGTQIFYSYTAPFFLFLSFFISSHFTERSEDFAWAFSALLLVSCPLASGFIYGRSAHKVGKRLDELRSALAGWTGVAKAGKQCIVSDGDLFPAGTVACNGARTIKGFRERKVLAYTAALTKAGELGAFRVFEEMMVVRNLTIPQVRDPVFHDAGGISARIGPDSVLVGGSDFLELMGMSIPEGLHVNHAIFCCINNKLAGFFTLDYDLSFTAEHSIEGLIYEHIRPVLATRDFALTPKMLKHRFNLNTARMDFPSIVRRQELSSSDRPGEGVLTAMLSREGITPVSECVIGAGRLRKTVYQGIALSLLSSILGFSLVAYLVMEQSYAALAPVNLLVFCGLWLFPFWFLTDLPQRF